MNLLFLDFDGVLHPAIIDLGDEHRRFEKVPLFESILRQAPGVSIVISSSWRLQYPMPVMLGFFSPDIANRIIGGTPDPYDVDPTPDLRMHYRQAEIDAWLRQNRLRDADWVALDDHAEGFQPGLRRLVHCKNPLDEETAERLLKALKKAKK